MQQKITSKTFNDCEVCAYHESGHILFAYLCGYTCIEAQLISPPNADGYSSYAVIDYGKDAATASKILNRNLSIDDLKAASLAEKMEVVEVGRKLSRIYIGGSVTATVYNNKGNVHVPLPVQMDLDDLENAEHIQNVLQQLSSDQERDFIENGLHQALNTLSNTNVWNTAADLANRLLEMKQIQKGDIEECLEEHGLFFDEASST